MQMLSIPLSLGLIDAAFDRAYTEVSMMEVERVIPYGLWSRLRASLCAFCLLKPIVLSLSFLCLCRPCYRYQQRFLYEFLVDEAYSTRRFVYLLGTLWFLSFTILWYSFSKGWLVSSRSSSNLMMLSPSYLISFIPSF